MEIWGKPGNKGINKKDKVSKMNEEEAGGKQ